jgi:hypothetical protein
MFYGAFNAITINYVSTFLNSECLLLICKILEFLIVVWFTHQVLKRHLFQKMGLGQASIETLKLPKIYIEKAMFLIKKSP